MKAVAAGGEDAAEQIARLLREGRAAEVTDEMLGALGPNDQARLFELYESGATGMDLPMDVQSRMSRAEDAGFDMMQDFYHGSAIGGYNDTVDIKAFDPAKSGDRWNADKRGFAITNSQRDANFYAKPTDRPFGRETPDGAVYPLMDRSQNLLDMRVGPLDGPISAWDGRPADTYSVIDRGGHDGARLAGDDVEMRVVMDPANIRSRHARFDPRLKNNADLLASRAAPGGMGDYSTQEARAAPRGVMAIPMRPSSPSMPSGAGPSLSDALSRMAQAFGTAGRAGIEGMATALSGVDEQGRSVGSILPFAKDERTGEVGLASPRILDLWNTAGGVVPAKGITLGAGPVMRVADSALDMSQEARMARARDMGFDVDRPVYHGTNANVREFRDVSEGTTSHTFGDFQTKRHGAFFTDNPEFAKEYGNTVGSYFVKGNEVADVDKLRHDFLESLDAFDDREMWTAARYAKEPWMFFDGKLGERFTEWLKKQGYSAAQFYEEIPTKADGYVDGTTTVILDPKNIRSTHAAFDPAKRDSADLLASRAAPGSLGIGGERRLTYRDIEDWL